MIRISKRLTFLALFCVLSTTLSLSWAHTVEWAIPPSRYYGLQFYRHGLYIFNDDSMRFAGIVDTQGNELYRGERAGFGIQYLGDGVSIIIDIKGNMGKEIKGLLFDEGHRFVKFPSGYYMKTPYITEGTLCVQDEQAMIGFLDINGNVVVKPQFNWAAPFRDGLALIHGDNGEWFYITRDWDSTHTPLKVEGGRISEANSFSNGHTFIKNKNGWVKIGTDGKVIKETRAKTTLPNTRDYSENAIRNRELSDHPEKWLKQDTPIPGNIKRYTNRDSLLGYTLDGEVIVPIQFWNNEAEDFDGDYCVVMLTQNPRSAQGLLHLVDGNFTPTHADDIIGMAVTARNDTIYNPLNVAFAYPASLNDDLLHVRLITPDNTQADSVVHQFNNGTAQFIWQPTIDELRGRSEGTATYQVLGECDLVLWEQSVPFTIQTAEPPRDTIAVISISGVEYQRVGALIQNPESGNRLLASLSIEANGLILATNTATVRPGDNTTIHATVDNIDSSTNAVAVLKLSNGQQTSAEVVLTPAPKKESSVSTAPKTTQRSSTTTRNTTRTASHTGNTKSDGKKTGKTTDNKSTTTVKPVPKDPLRKR